MKILLFAVALLCSITFAAQAQMTLAHLYPTSGSGEAEVVNLSFSGKKIMVVNFKSSSITPEDTIYFYNMDYSLWKKIICPVIPSYTSRLGGSINRYGADLDIGLVNVFYPSESLFNTDTFLEAAVLYFRPTKPLPYVSLFVINENSTLTDSIVDINLETPVFTVHETTPGVFKAIVSTSAGVNIYDLPGTIPCNTCAGPLGLANLEKPKPFPTQPIPNPSSNEVKITFTLPEGVHEGELNLYNTAGQKLRSFKVDDRFGFVLLDNTQLPSGLYYYNIISNGSVSTTQKMVVLK